jgi:hypothetical protein
MSQSGGRRRIVRASMTRLACALVAVLAVAGATASAAMGLSVGAASVDVTPPPRTTASDAAFVPACGATPEQVAQLWPGPRQFAFEEPYVDSLGVGRYAPGDPYCDANVSHRFEAPYIAGGSGQNHWPTSADPGNGPGAQAVVFATSEKRVALVSIDSIGMFNVTMDRIRAAVAQLDPAISEVFISSTHDESAPDPIGLWGPDLGDLPEHPETPAAVSSGVDEYYFDFLVDRVAHAVAQADAAARPAKLSVAIGSMPSNTQSCWSSYPFIDDQSMPVMQARDRKGQVIATLADVSTHAETLAFSGVPSYVTTLSADWPGAMRADMEARWPGSVGMELAGLVGSVETPTVYEPETTQVLRVPGPLHNVPGNPDGCRSVYPEPSSGTPVSDAHEFISAYGQSMADAAASALQGAKTVGTRSITAQQQSVCILLENNFFIAAFGAGLFPDRPAYADSACTVESKPGSAPSSPPGGPESSSAPTYLKSNVGVLTLGPIQLAYSPGEVFPFTEIRGPIDKDQMPFPTDCWEQATENYYCGNPLPMTPWISAKMTKRYRFLVGLGEDMIGYLFPPGNFVGDEGEVTSEPWASYETSGANGGRDRFGYGHSDDAEAVGPYAGLAVTNALQELLAGDGRPSKVVPGLFMDAAGHLSDSPFASPGFSGAVGVKTAGARSRTYVIGSNASGWATFEALPDPGTAGTGLGYSVRTAGVIRNSGGPLLIDVFAGGDALH